MLEKPGHQNGVLENISPPGKTQGYSATFSGLRPAGLPEFDRSKTPGSPTFSWSLRGQGADATGSSSGNCRSSVCSCSLKMAFRVLGPFTLEALLVSGARTQLCRPRRPRCQRTANQVSPVEVRAGRASVGRRCVPGVGFGEQDACVTPSSILPPGVYSS